MTARAPACRFAPFSRFRFGTQGALRNDQGGHCLMLDESRPGTDTAATEAIKRATATTGRRSARACARATETHLCRRQSPMPIWAATHGGVCRLARPKIERAGTE